MIPQPRQSMDLQLRRFLDEQAAASTGPARSPWDARARMLQALESRSIPGLPNGVQTADHLVTSGDTALRVRVYTPPLRGATPLPVLVYLHGGGWIAGSIETHDPFCRLLAPLAGVSIVSVDYRLAPESPYPAALEDTEAAVTWTTRNARSWGGDPTLLALGGDSSGGNLAAVVANHFALRRDGPQLRALLLLYPVTDHYNSAAHVSWYENATGCGLEAATMRWYWDLYTAGAPPEDASLSPLRMPGVLNLPPALIATAEYDVLRDEGIAYARKLEQAGIAVTHLHSPDMHHNFPVGPATVARFSQSDRTLGQIAAWLRGRFAAGV